MNPVRLDTARGPNGEIVVRKTYTNGRYTVTMNADGAIRVKRGDWLSKYSAAMYDNYWMVNEFARMDHSGKLVPIRNPNLISAGEVVYHLPTYYEFSKISFPAKQITVVRTDLMSEDRKKQIILEHLKGEFDLRGENFEIIETVADGIHMASELSEAGECLASILVHAPEAVEAFISGPLAIAGAVAFPIFATIKLINAWQFGQRLIGLRAIAYGMTAWAFGDQRPGPPAWIRSNMKFAGSQEYDIRASEKAWSDSCEKAWSNMEDAALKQILSGNRTGPKRSIRMRKEWLQALFRAIGDVDRNKLVKKLMEGIARKYLRAGMETDAFWSPPPSYPP
jgi:hypothetical protein